tara:strand:- start:271 stop:606 length:336 start_codon:yes stop_codon:yes gene_type:complete
MTEEKIVPMTEGSEDEAKKNIEEQEQKASQLGRDIMGQLEKAMEDGLHPAAGAMLMADLAAAVCVNGEIAGISMITDALSRHIRERLDNETKAHEAVGKELEKEEKKENTE